MTHPNIPNSYFSWLSRRLHSCTLRAGRYAVFVFTFIVLFGATDTYALVSGADAAPSIYPEPGAPYYLCDASGKGFCATTFPSRKTAGTPIIVTNTKLKSSATTVKWSVVPIDPVSALRPFNDNRYNNKYAHDEIYYIQIRGTNQNECMSPKVSGKSWKLVLQSCNSTTQSNDFWILNGGWLISPAATNATGRHGAYRQVLTSRYGRRGDINGTLTTETGGKATAFHQNWKFVTSKP